VLVIAGGETAPLLDVAVPAFDHIAVLVVGSVECDRSAAACSATSAMALLVVGFRDDRLDPAGTQVTADRSGRIRLVAPHRIRAGSRSTSVAANAQVRHEWQEHRRVARLARGEESHQRQPVAVDELVDLRR